MSVSIILIMDDDKTVASLKDVDRSLNGQNPIFGRIRSDNPVKRATLAYPAEDMVDPNMQSPYMSLAPPPIQQPFAPQQPFASGQPLSQYPSRDAGSTQQIYQPMGSPTYASMGMNGSMPAGVQSMPFPPQQQMQSMPSPPQQQMYATPQFMPQQQFMPPQDPQFMPPPQQNMPPQQFMPQQQFTSQPQPPQVKVLQPFAGVPCSLGSGNLSRGGGGAQSESS